MTDERVPQSLDAILRDGYPTEEAPEPPTIEEWNAGLRAGIRLESDEPPEPPRDPMTSAHPPSTPPETDWGGGARGPDTGGVVPAGLYGRVKPDDLNALLRDGLNRRDR